MADQEQVNNNNNIICHFHGKLKSVQIGGSNSIQSTNEQTGNMEYDVEQLKVTVAAQGQKLENQAEQLNTQAEQMKVYDRIFKQLPANQQINSQQLANNSTITLRCFNGYPGGKVEELHVNKGIRELTVKLQQLGVEDGDVVHYR